jgi:hypothetical protein
MGKTSVKTACNPVFFRRDGGESVWRNSRYELVCSSMRLGGAITSLILPKWTRSVGLNDIFTSGQCLAQARFLLAETTKRTLSGNQKTHRFKKSSL